MTDCPTAKLGRTGVTPWGRRAFEYRAFFGLADDQLPGQILDCGAGPSSFIAELTRAGSRVVAVDPIYHLQEFDLQRIFADAEERIARALAAEQQRFIWDFYGDIDGLLRVRREAAELFLADFPMGLAQGRYICGQLPELNFASGSFRLALCSHLLFLYSDELGLQFHLDALAELARVPDAVRVFPLISLDGAPSPFVDPAQRFLRERGLFVMLKPVPFEFQRGANQVFCVRRPLGRNPTTTD